MDKKVDHKNRKHALLSCSGASRWMNCTPSARLEEGFPESSSVYAEEGTLAHEFGDLNLQILSGQADPKEIEKELAKQRKHKLYTEEMEPQVEKYTDYVMEQLNVALQTDPSATLAIEEKFDLTHLIEDGFGTGDASVIGDGVLEVIDLKYGRQKVIADNNPQLKLYGLGALESSGMFYDIHTVRLTIVQPRLDHISTWDISVEDLEDWAENEAKPKAELAYDGKGKTCPGEWCHWCKAGARCRGQAEQNLEMAKHDFEDPDLLDDDEILAVYAQIPALTQWAAKVQDHVKAEALNGKKWDGYKLVEAKTNRKWKDPEETKLALSGQGYSYTKFSEAKLFGIGKIEELMGKVAFRDHMSDHVIKPVGAPTLVPDSDKRQAIDDSIKDDFKD